MTDDLIAEALPCECPAEYDINYAGHSRWCPAFCRPAVRKTFSQANADLLARVAELEGTLRWYEEQARNCRKLHGVPEGDSARQALDKDGGQRARAALTSTGGGDEAGKTMTIQLDPLSDEQIEYLKRLQDAQNYDPSIVIGRRALQEEDR